MSDDKIYTEQDIDNFVDSVVEILTEDDDVSYVRDLAKDLKTKALEHEIERLKKELAEEKAKPKFTFPESVPLVNPNVPYWSIRSPYVQGDHIEVHTPDKQPWMTDVKCENKTEKS